MSDRSENLGASLSALWHKDAERNGIMLIGKDPERIALGRKLLQPEFPGFKIKEAEFREQAASLIAESVKWRVAIIIDFNGDDVSGDDLRQRINASDAEAQSIPNVLVVYAGEEAEGRDADAVLTMPFNMTDFRAGVAEAILRRSGKFEAMEQVTKMDVLRDFCEYYMALVSTWGRDIVSTKCFRDRTPPEIYDLPGNAGETWRLLENLYDFVKGGQVGKESLRVIFHDLNNKLTPLIGYTEIILDEFEGQLQAHDVEILKRISSEVSQMAVYTSLITKAYNERCSWRKVQSSKPTVQPRERLEIPEGTKFCVIDDTQAVLTLTKKTIEVAGGRAVAVNSKEALEKLFEGVEGEAKPDLQVFLLDHNLGDGVFGYQLIDSIRAQYPGALIIAHTSDATAINSDPENWYKKAGVEVVSKRAWHAISGIAKKKLPKLRLVA